MCCVCVFNPNIFNFMSVINTTYKHIFIYQKYLVTNKKQMCESINHPFCSTVVH